MNLGPTVSDNKENVPGTLISVTILKPFLVVILIDFSCWFIFVDYSYCFRRLTGWKWRWPTDLVYDWMGQLFTRGGLQIKCKILSQEM